LTFAVVTVLVVVLMALGAVDRARDARTRSVRIIGAGAQAEEAIVDMETGLRGYWLTGQRHSLQPWFRGRAAFFRDFAALRATSRIDAPADHSVVAAIGRQGAAYVLRYGDPIVRRGTRGMTRARIVAATAAGKRRVDRLRALFDRLEAISNGQERSRRVEAAASVSRARDTALVGLLGVLVLVGLAAIYLVRGVSLPVRRITQAADTLSGGQLSARAPVQGPGEVARLGRAFNEMAGSIEEGLRTVNAKNAHLEVSRSEAQRMGTELEAQQQLAVDLVATVGFDGYFKRVNPAWERTLGYPEDELKSRPFIEYVHPDDRERTEVEAAKLAQAEGDTINFENRYRTKSGTYRWLEWNVRPIAEQELLYAIARDVTARNDANREVREARDEAQRANQAKSEFLSRMSHELRTPLNAILGFGQLLEMDGFDGAQGESVEQILRGGRHLLGLIDEILDISRIEAGTMTLSLEPVELTSALSDVLALVRPLAAERGIALDADLPPAGEVFVLADRQRLRQVVLNLVSNAIKYNRDGGSVRLAHTVDDGHVRMGVSDTGPGIPADRIDALFSPFERLGAEETEVQGTGLGLVLSKTLVEAMGGLIHVESRPGEGSVFTVELAAAANPVDEQALGTVRASRNGVPSTLGAHTLLYIEDNLSNFRLVEQIFAGDREITLLPAMQGTLGLELARQHRPDLILLDLHLPDLEGRVVLERLKADPATRDIPVVILSADATQRQIRHLLASGADDYLTKPIDVRKFLDVVGRSLAVEGSS
jgi:PAS domain S-box-containing protein